MVAKKRQIEKESRESEGEPTAESPALWSHGTRLGKQYFSSSGLQAHTALIDALLETTRAAATANGDLGVIESDMAEAIIKACDYLLQRKDDSQFPVDAICGGSGIGLVINLDEVIISLISGAPKPDSTQQESADRVMLMKFIRASHSYSDAFVTAMKIAILTCMDDLEPVLIELERLLRRKSLEFERILKAGRTNLRAQQPITLGQEFNAYGSSVERAASRLKERKGDLLEISLGAGSIGTGFNSHPRFSEVAIGRLAARTGRNLRVSEDFIRTTQSMSDFVAFSSSLNNLAIELTKVAQDLRLLSSDPVSGPGEIKLPSLGLPEEAYAIDANCIDEQIPPMTEQLTMICQKVMGADHSVMLAGTSGVLEGNSTTPLIADCILSSINILGAGIGSFNRHCLSKLVANPDRCKETLSSSSGILLALATELGIEKARQVAAEARERGCDVKGYLLDTKLIPRASVDRIFHHKHLTTPGLIKPASQPEDTKTDTN